MAENAKNMHKHGMGKIILASILLICIAVTSLIITFSALSADDDDERPHKKDPDTEDSDGEGNDDGTGDDGSGNQSGEDDSGDQNDTPKNTSVDKKSSDVHRGPLLSLSEENPYNRPAEELISSSAMDSLSPGEVLSRYNFINVSSRSDGNFKPRNRLLYLDTAAATAFCDMMAQFVAETGVTYIQLRDAYVNRGATDPHTTGMAVDLNIYDGGLNYPLKNSYKNYRAHYGWFTANCHKFGFVHVQDTNSYSTFRYIGIPHAGYINSNFLTLDAYLELVRSKTADDRLVMTDANGNEWWVYYVEASGSDTTSIKVFGSKYTISGDNVNGFIVSVDTSGIK